MKVPDILVAIRLIMLPRGRARATWVGFAYSPGYAFGGARHTAERFVVYVINIFCMGIWNHYHMARIINPPFGRNERRDERVL